MTKKNKPTLPYNWKEDINKQLADNGISMHRLSLRAELGYPTVHQYLTGDKDIRISTLKRMLSALKEIISEKK